MQIILLAAGKGSRIYKKIKINKSLIKLKKKTIIRRLIENIPNQKNCIKNEELAKIVTKCGIDSESSDDVKKTLKKISSKDPGSLIMICGSLYLAGELLNIN